MVGRERYSPWGLVSQWVQRSYAFRFLCRNNTEGCEQVCDFLRGLGGGVGGWRLPAHAAKYRPAGEAVCLCGLQCRRCTRTARPSCASFYPWGPQRTRSSARFLFCFARIVMFPLSSPPFHFRPKPPQRQAHKRAAMPQQSPALALPFSSTGIPFPCLTYSSATPPSWRQRAASLVPHLSGCVTGCVTGC